VEDSLSAHVEEYREGQSASGCQAADLALEPREDALHFRHIAASVLPDRRLRHHSCCDRRNVGSLRLESSSVRDNADVTTAIRELEQNR